MCDLHNRDEADAGEPAPVQVSDFVDEIVVALTSARMYSGDHARVQASLDTLLRGLSEAGDPVRPVLEIGTVDGYLFHDNLPLLGASLSAPRLLEPLARLGSGGLSFARSTTRPELRTFVDFLGQKSLGDARSYREANQCLEHRDCVGVRFLPPFASARRAPEPPAPGRPVDPSNPWGSETRRGLVDVPLQLYQGVVDHLQDTLVRVVHGEELNVDEARGHVAGILRRVAEDTTSMMRLCRYERYDTFTFGHSVRVCFLAVHFARQLTDDPELLQRVGLSALLHDIGKAWVPFEILHSTGALDPDARAEMSRHTEYGGEILLRLSDADPLPVTVAFGHHRSEGGERSYPRTLHRARQSAALRIVKLCDVFEALTAVRPYKPAMSALRAYRIMMSMKGAFDPGLLQRFVHANGLYPDGSRVRLGTGEVGLVVRQTDALDAPVVLVERDRGGGEVPPEDRWELDLRSPDSLAAVSVEEVLTEPAALARPAA